MKHIAKTIMKTNEKHCNNNEKTMKTNEKHCKTMKNQ